jgi:hypothetical protein
MNIIVYTAIFGDIDRLWPPYPPALGGARHVCFSDKPRDERGLWNDKGFVKGSGDRMTPGGPFWQVRVVQAKWKPRRSARYYKALPHRVFPDADAWVWIDGNLRLLIPPGKAVKKWLKGDLATFNHPDRRCLYDEAAFCASKGKDKRAVLTAQTDRYRDAGMPAGWGLPETRCVIRRNTERVRTLNELWWLEMERYSVRDQVSLPFLCWKAGMRWDVIPGRAWVGGKNVNRDFWFVRHKDKL